MIPAANMAKKITNNTLSNSFEKKFIVIPYVLFSQTKNRDIL